MSTTVIPREATKTSRKRPNWRLGPLLLVCLSLAACSGKRTLVLQPQADLNCCGQKFGRGLDVRIYVLEDDARIRVPQRDLWAQPADQAVWKQLSLDPDPKDVRQVQLELPKGKNVVAVVGDFCETQGDDWKWVHPVESLAKKTTLTLTCGSIREETH